jgi:photosystem II stability/assembly factor-like uncharacterized protein
MFTIKSVLTLSLTLFALIFTSVCANAGDYNSVKFNNDMLFLASSESGVLYSKDLGNHWTESETPFVNPLVGVTAFQKVNNNILVAVGKSGQILVSFDQGISFSGVGSETGDNLNDVKLFADGCLVTVGNNGTILTTEDKGVTWKQKKSNVTVNLNKIAVAGNTIFVVGDKGTLLISKDGGNSWERIKTRMSIKFSAIIMIDKLTGTIVGENNTIMHTFDGGYTWLMLHYAIGENLNDIYALSTDIFIAIGNKGLILRSSDSGNDWYQVSTYVTSDLLSVTYSGAFTGVVSGKDNTLLCTFDGGKTWKNISKPGLSAHMNSIKNENVTSPNSFSLSQNFPNPFNPTTKISFQLPADSKVSLKVFDITGKEVATLVNDFRPAGSNTVEFNAGNFASGVYLYKIEAGSFIQTKKMILTK